LVSCTYSHEQGFNITDIENKILAEVNFIRQNNNLETLTISSAFSDVARKHSQDMVDRNYLEHKAPEGNMAWDRVKNAGLSYGAVMSENLHREKRKLSTESESIAATTLSSWINSSEGHRENILEPEWRTTGIGVAISSKPENGRYNIVVTELFFLDKYNIDKLDMLLKEINHIDAKLLALQENLDSARNTQQENGIISQYNIYNSQRTKLISDYNIYMQKINQIKQRVKA
jgi:uncharacterized protein YkwD